MRGQCDGRARLGALHDACHCLKHVEGLLRGGARRSAAFICLRHIGKSQATGVLRVIKRKRMLLRLAGRAVKEGDGAAEPVGVGHVKRSLRAVDLNVRLLRVINIKRGKSIFYKSYVKKLINAYKLFDLVYMNSTNIIYMHILVYFGNFLILDKLSALTLLLILLFLKDMLIIFGFLLQRLPNVDLFKCFIDCFFFCITLGLNVFFSSSWDIEILLFSIEDSCNEISDILFEVRQVLLPVLSSL
jgi:hypothetical protein